MKGKIFIAFSLFCIALTSCKNDFLRNRPDGFLLEQDVAENGIVEPLINGIYSYLYSYNSAGRSSADERHDDFGQKSIDITTDLMTEDMVQYLHHWFGFDYLLDDREAPFSRTFTNWNFYYKIIYNANSVLVKIDSAPTKPSLKAAKGQALALRAFALLNLAQLYQQTYKGSETSKGVPIYRAPIFEGQPRSSMNEVYSQIETDLKEAIHFLADFQRASKDQVDINVAQGLLARAYLNMENWTGAAEMANKARTGYTPMTGDEYNDGFSDISNAEWMWGSDISTTTQTAYASFFSHMDNTGFGYAGVGVYKLIDKRLFDQIPLTDKRRQAWTEPGDTDYPNLPEYTSLKFRDENQSGNVFPGDYVYMRAAEMYLIEAEALAHLGSNGPAAQVLFELLTTRDPAYVLSTKTGQALIDEIVLNRRIELWGEGFSLNDFKRWKKGIDRTGSNHREDAQFVIPAGDPDFVFQIPQRELDTNTSMNTTDQNP